MCMKTNFFDSTFFICALPNHVTGVIVQLPASEYKGITHFHVTMASPQRVQFQVGELSEYGLIIGMHQLPALKKD